MNKVEKVSTLIVLKYLNMGFYPKQIADKFKVDKSAITYHIKKLEKMGYLHMKYRSSCKIFDITPKGKTALGKHEVEDLSYSMKPTFECHDLTFKIPIVPFFSRPKTPDNFWDTVNDKIVNHIQKIKNIELLRCTVRDTGKNICVQARHRKLGEVTQIPELFHELVNLVCAYFRQYGYMLSVNEAKLTNIHIVVLDADSQELVKKNVKIKVPLGRNRHKFTENDPNQFAYVELDTSPFKKGNWETNDYENARLRALMPEYIEEMRQMVAGNRRIMMEMQNTQFLITSFIKRITKLLEEKK